MGTYRREWEILFAVIFTGTDYEKFNGQMKNGAASY
jgi:hypothetical protein